MRSFGFSAVLAAGALALGGISIQRGQYLLGACLIGIGLLKASTVFQKRKPVEHQAEIRLNLSDPDEPPKHADESDSV